MLHYTYAFLAFSYYCALKDPYNLKKVRLHFSVKILTFVNLRQWLWIVFYRFYYVFPYVCVSSFLLSSEVSQYILMLILLFFLSVMQPAFCMHTGKAKAAEGSSWEYQLM